MTITHRAIPPINARWKVGIAVLAVLLLSAPSAVGVYRALEPTRGAIAAGLAAAGFELAYLSLSLLTLRPALRQQARAVALGAVITAIALNGLADYAHRVVGGLASWAAAQHLFDPLALILSLAESAPLAGLAFALASLLHRLAEEQAAVTHETLTDVDPAEPAMALAWARDDHDQQPHYPAPELVGAGHAPIAFATATNAAAPTVAYACPACGAGLPSAGAYGAATRWGRCKHCSPAAPRPTEG